MSDSTIHMYLNPVRADRVAAFEEFLDKVDGAMRSDRPDLVGRWQVLKATEPEEADQGVITYAFVFQGGDLDADWDLTVLLPAHFGAEEAERMLREWGENFVPFRDWVAALGSPDDEITQVGWTFSELRPSGTD